MSHFTLRKPLAAAAVLAASVGAVLATSAPAGATTYGIAGSPVTVTANGVVTIIGGGTVALPAGARDVSWSGQGGRLAFIGADQGVYTADFDGSHIVKIAQGVAPSHTVWDLSSMSVYWTEGTGTAAKIVGANGNGVSMGWPQKTYDLVANPPAGLGLSYADVAADNGTSAVFQTTDAAGRTGISIATYDASGRQVVTEIVAPGDAATGGSQPTVSPDGKTVVFVRADASGDKQLFATWLVNGAWSVPGQITATTGDSTAPVYEADNLNVAFTFTNRANPVGAVTDGTYQITLPLGGMTAGGEKKISDLVGGVAVRTDAHGRTHRLGGYDRYATAVTVSQQSWRTKGDTSDTRAQAQAVVLTRGDDFADALGGTALATHKNAPLLLTGTAALTPATQDEITRVLPAGGTVYVLGGEAAVSKTVTDKLSALGYQVARIGGYDRYETAVNIANTVDPNADSVLVATGALAPDALSAGAVAAGFNGTVVVLTNGATMPDSTNAFIAGKLAANKLSFLAAVGGAANTAVSSKWDGATAIVGADRYETSYLVAKQLFGAFQGVGVATGAQWPDALSGGALVGRDGGPLLLVDPAAGLSAADDALLDANRGSLAEGFVFGGPAALPARVDDQLAADVRTAVGVLRDNGYKTAFQLTTPDISSR